MLVFIDESGNPHPNDSSPKPVIVAVCIDEPEVRRASSRIYALKRQVLIDQSTEIKALQMLNRGTFRRVQEKREFVESFFDLLRELPITVFAIKMERPQQTPPETDFLPNQFRFLLERIALLAESQKQMATLLFDGDGIAPFGGLSEKFNSYLHRSNEGRALTTITDGPYFVDSRITVGIQIADMAAGVVRLYEENELFRGVPAGDSFLHAISRFYRIVESKTVNQTNADGYTRYGLHQMPERGHYINISPEIW